MKKKHEKVIKVILLILLLIGIYAFSYVISYIRYNNSEKIEINVLRNENERLQKEINNLKKQLNIDFGNFNYIMSQVTIRDIHNFYKEIILNRGSNDGIRKGMAVVNEEGLVAVIDHVDKNTSKAKLLTSEYNVSVQLANTYGNLSNKNVDMLDKYSEIKEGDYIYTSGLAYMPKGIYVGKVLNVSYDKNNLGKIVKVDLIDNKDLNYVAIIKGEK